MSEQYSQEDVARLKKETLAVMRRRIVAESRVKFLQDEGELENMCRIDGEPMDAFKRRCERICRLSELCANYLRQEMETVKKYINACWAYQIGMDKPL